MGEDRNWDTLSHCVFFLSKWVNAFSANWTKGTPVPSLPLLYCIYIGLVTLMTIVNHVQASSLCLSTEGPLAHILYFLCKFTYKDTYTHILSLKHNTL